MSGINNEKLKINSIRYYSSYVNLSVLEKSTRKETVDEFVGKWNISCSQLDSLSEYNNFEELFIKITMMGIIDVEEFLKDLIENPRKFKCGYRCNLFSNQNEITFPPFIEKIGSCWIYGIKNPVSVTIPENIQLIEGGNFSNISSKIDINIKDGVKAFGNRCFSNIYACGIKVRLPKSLEYIGDYCFSDNDYLPTVIIPSNIEYGKNTFCNHFNGWKVTSIKDRYIINYV